MDLQMPRMNGLEATRQVLAGQPGVGVIVVTMFEDDESVFVAMRAGARGYVLKGADRDEILRAIHAVASGEAIFGPAIAQRLMSFFATASRPTTTILPELTDRERNSAPICRCARLFGASNSVRLATATKRYPLDATAYQRDLCTAQPPLENPTSWQQWQRDT